MANKNTKQNTKNAAIPRGIINHVFCAAGRDDENNRSVAPAEKLNPALKPNATVIIVNIP